MGCGLPVGQVAEARQVPGAGGTLDARNNPAPSRGSWGCHALAVAGGKTTFALPLGGRRRWGRWRAPRSLEAGGASRSTNVTVVDGCIGD